MRWIFRTHNFNYYKRNSGVLNLLLVLMVALQNLSCDQKPAFKDIENEINPFVENSVDTDLDNIKERGILKALVIYSSTSYFLYRGQPMGFEYELLERLTDHLNLELELVVSDDLDSEFEVLNRGDVDLIAHGMTITNQRKWEVDFTEHLYLTRQVLVQRKPDNYQQMTWDEIQKKLVKDPIELINDTVSIRKNAAYVERLLSLSNEIGGPIYIDTLDSRLTTDEIIEMVAEGKIKYTVADENLAKINASYYPNLHIDVPISFSQRIAWVTRKKAKNLRKAVNEWIKSIKKESTYYVIYNKYFNNKRTFRRRIKSEYYSLKNNQISPYDDLLKKYAGEIGWDWRLLASQIYQESRFDPQAESWAGAAGLMQIMPSTAELIGLDSLAITNPEESIKAGITYMKILYKRFSDIPDSLNRIKFTLAAYNCGFGHIRDAQQLALKNGLHQTIWSGNVEKMLLTLNRPEIFNKPFIKNGYVRGKEPVNYIKQIFERYDHYRQFIHLE